MTSNNSSHSRASPSIAHHCISNPFLFISLVVLELHRPFILVDLISFVGGRIDHHALAVMVDLKINTGERMSNDLFFDRHKKEKETDQGSPSVPCLL